MTGAEAKQQADDLAGKIDDLIHDHPPGPIGSTAAAIVRRLPQLLYQAGWLTPDVHDRIRDWAERTGNLPEHHVNRSVLTSHLAELADILHGR